jgi:hypothetical protein
MKAIEGERRTSGRRWTVEAVRDLGVTTDVETAAAILGIGRTKAYDMAKRGQFPVRLLRVGRRYLVPTPAILALLGLDERPAA